MTQGRTKSAFSSAGTLISVVSVLIFCAGFVRVEIKLNEQEERMSEMGKLLRVKNPSSSEVKSSKKDSTMDLTGRKSPQFCETNFHIAKVYFYVCRSLKWRHNFRSLAVFVCLLGISV